MPALTHVADDKLYISLPWYKKILAQIKEGFHLKWNQFRFPWKKLIALGVLGIFAFAIYIIVKVNEVEFPVRDPYDKSDFISSEELIQQYGESITITTDDYIFHFNTHDTTFSIEDRQVGTTWLSNPETTSKRFLNPIELYYAGSLGKVSEIDVQEQAVDYGDYAVRIEDDSIEVLYFVGGKKEVDADDFPEIISDERMQSLILSKLDPSSTEYRRITKQAYVSGEVDGVLVWKLKDGIQKSILQELYRIFYDVCGYTSEELKYDQEAFGIVIEDKYPYFEISVRYTLSVNGFQVEVLNDSIVEKEKYPLIYVDVLPYFGCGLITDEGYLFVPDGSGALIDFNSSRSFLLPYNKRIYGKEYAAFYDEYSEETSKISFPVIGIKKNEYSFISVVENGAAMANVYATNSSQDNPYNQVFYRYYFREGEVYQFDSINSTVSINEWTNAYNEDDLILQFIMLEAQDAGYVEMAKTYQAYLLSTGELVGMDETSKPTLDLTLLGGYTIKEQFLGIPYQTVKSLTTADNVLDISSVLVSDGVDYLNVFYRGFSNRGLKSTYIGNLDYNKAIGTKNELQSMTDSLADLEVSLYPEVYFNTAYTDKGLRTSKDVIRDVFGKVVYQYEYNPASYYIDTSTKKIYTLLPSTYKETMSEIMTLSDQLHVNNMAFTDFGSQTYGSYQKKNTVFRTDTVDAFIDIMEKTSFDKMMFRNPNLYALKYASVITDLNQSSSNYQIISRSIPFVELVLSGYIDYSLEAINTSDDHDYQYNIMKIIELGANLSAEWSYETTIDLVDTEYSYYYSTYYQNWYNKILSSYQELEQLGIYQSFLVDHETLTEDGLVVKVRYDNGTSIIINYREYSYSYEGNTIGPNQYEVLRGDDE